MMRFRTRRDAAGRPAAPVDLAYRPQFDARVGQAAALVRGSAVRDRIMSSPVGYALAHRPEDIARHAALLEALPSLDEVRVASTPAAAPGTWNLDIVALDRPGLLACFTGVLVHASIEIVRAVLATWEDGAALQALVVRAGQEPDVAALERALRWSLDQAVSAPPVDGTTVSFDQHASSLYTACEVTGPDRPGLLHAIAVAITNAGGDIHAASVATQFGVAVDRFDLSTSDNRKLEPSARDEIAANLRAGFSGIPSGRGRR